MFLDDEKISIEAPTAAGVTTIDSAVYDMSGFGSITFVVRFGTPAANNNIRLREDVASGGAFADVAASILNDPAINAHVAEVLSPSKQFVRCRITRGTSTTIDSVVVIQRDATVRPVTQPTLVSKKQFAV